MAGEEGACVESRRKLFSSGGAWDGPELGAGADLEMVKMYL